MSLVTAQRSKSATEDAVILITTESGKRFEIHECQKEVVDIAVVLAESLPHYTFDLLVSLFVEWDAQRDEQITDPVEFFKSQPLEGE